MLFISNCSQWLLCVYIMTLYTCQLCTIDRQPIILLFHKLLPFGMLCPRLLYPPLHVHASNSFPLSVQYLLLYFELYCYCCCHCSLLSSVCFILFRGTHITTMPFIVSLLICKKIVTKKAIKPWHQVTTMMQNTYIMHNECIFCHWIMNECSYDFS